MTRSTGRIIREPFKLHAKAIGPFVVVDADESTFVMDVDGIEKSSRGGHATPAPRLDDVIGVTWHPLLDRCDKPRPEPVAHTEYVIHKLMFFRKLGDSYEFKVRWYDSSSKDDT